MHWEVPGRQWLSKGHVSLKLGFESFQVFFGHSLTLSFSFCGCYSCIMLASGVRISDCKLQA